jgi:hypothetical protein
MTSAYQTSTDLAARRNVATFAMATGPVLREPLGARASFLLSYPRMALLAGASAERSVVVAAVDVSGEVVASRRFFDRSAVVVGRHEQCGIRLPAHTVALRHIAALVQLPPREGRPRIDLRDLATRQPFRTEDGLPSAAVTADGPLYVALGEYALWFIPSDTLVAPAGRAPSRSAEEAWFALAPRGFVERRPPVDAPRPAPLRAAPPVGHTCITHLAAPLLLDDGDAPEVSWGELRLELGARKEKRWVSAERLEQGVLLGRYSRCGVLLDAAESTTSRVHALLMRLGADVWIIDLASTNGVKRDGVPVTADILRDKDRLSLGSQVTMGWTRLRHAQA